MDRLIKQAGESRLFKQIAAGKFQGSLDLIVSPRVQTLFDCLHEFVASAEAEGSLGTARAIVFVERVQTAYALADLISHSKGPHLQLVRPGVLVGHGSKTTNTGSMSPAPRGMRA